MNLKNILVTTVIAVIAAMIVVAVVGGKDQPQIIVREGNQLGGGSRFISGLYSDFLGFTNLATSRSATSTDAYVDWHQVRLESTEDTEVFTNNTTSSRFYDFAEIIGTASNTAAYRIYVIATTTSSIPDSLKYTNLTAKLDDTLVLMDVKLGTSTTATSTNSIWASANRTYTTEGGGSTNGPSFRTNGEGSVEVPIGWSLIVFQQLVDPVACSSVGTLPCLAATSSVSTPYDVFLRYHATTTIP